MQLLLNPRHTKHLTDFPRQLIADFIMPRHCLCFSGRYICVKRVTTPLPFEITSVFTQMAEQLFGFHSKVTNSRLASAG